ncbi:MAG: hypothetical protein AAFR20_10300 [Pseudomonadota bacterium]
MASLRRHRFRAQNGALLALFGRALLGIAAAILPGASPSWGQVLTPPSTPHTAPSPDAQTSLSLFAKGETAFFAGRYEDVLAMARTRLEAKDPVKEDAGVLALAARTENTRAYLRLTPKAASAQTKSARAYARAALARDPVNVEAHLQAAISDAVRGGQVGPIRALFGGYASRARRHLDQALATAPENFWALSTSGAWHLEVARAGGAGVYGADRALGFNQMIRARALAPDNVAIAYETALRVLASNNPDWRAAALDALTVATQTGAITAAHEAQLRERAVALARAVEAGPEAVRQFIKTYA